MFQKLTAWLTAILLLAGSGAALAQGEARELVLANPTKLSGAFFTDQGGNNSADIDVRLFVHGQGTVAYLREDIQAVNRTIVKNHTRTLDAQGNATHTFTIWEDLKFSDGSAVTARDFAGSILLQASPELLQITGWEQAPYAALVGQEAFNSGASDALIGLRLLGDYAFSLTIQAKALPNYNELSLVDVIPYPMAVLLPETALRDSGHGLGFSPKIDGDALAAAMLGDAGYISHPSVSFGPYRLLSYDAALGEARLARNPYYKGDETGGKPAIERIRLVEAVNETMVGRLKHGEIDVINKIAWHDAIVEAQAAFQRKELQLQAYSRRGLAYIIPSGDEGPTGSVLLRRALASLVDRERIIQKALRSNGLPVYGYYGVGQEMALGREAQLKEALHLYPFSPAAAEKLLAEDGWAYGADGKTLASSQGKPRFRKNGETLEPLVLSLAVSKGNPIALAIAELLTAQFRQAGGMLETIELEARDLFRAAYRQGTERYDLVFMGSNFGTIYDPSAGILAVSWKDDDDFSSCCHELLHTPPGDSAAYRAAWIHLQQKLVQQLPIIPLYSNTYYDAYTNDLLDYHPENYASVALALLHARWGSGD